MFGLLEFSIIKRYFNSKSWKLEYCDYGIIVDKYIKYEKNDNDYYFVVSVNQNNIKDKISLSEYQKLEIGDEVVLFAVENEERTFIAKKEDVL